MDHTLKWTIFYDFLKNHSIPVYILNNTIYIVFLLKNTGNNYIFDYLYKIKIIYLIFHLIHVHDYHTLIYYNNEIKE